MAKNTIVEEPSESVVDESFVVFERVRIPIPLFQARRRIKDLEEEVKMLKTRMEILEENEYIVPIEISDEIAEKEIRAMIKEKKNQGIKTIDDVEIMKRFNIPIEQIDKTIKKLIKDDIIAKRK